MNSRIRLIIWLPVILVIQACTGFFPTFQTENTSTPEFQATSIQPSPTQSATFTPIPSPTPTPTKITPTDIPTQTAIPSPSPTPLSIDTQLSIFEDLWSIVNNTYVYPDFNGLDWNAVQDEYKEIISAGMSNEQFYQAMSELIYSLGDEHSSFLNPQEVIAQEAEYQGKLDYVGIGILVSAVPEKGRAVILSVFSDSPAASAGLQPRDSIISVDHIPILDRAGFLRDIVRGPEGTTITLVVQTPGEASRELMVTRDRITGEVPVIHNVITTPDGKRIGYILLITFDDSTVDDQVAEALQEMTADAPLDGLILDNRMNGGGSSTVLKPMLSFFQDGDLGYFINRNEERPLQIELKDINGSSNVPLVILVGSGTASFGEIFAGILKDSDRAYLIGTTTEGNVEILWGYDLEDGSQLWLANETFRPQNNSDENWERTGIIPDLEINGEFDEYTLENDPAVLAAIQYLVNQ